MSGTRPTYFELERRCQKAEAALADMARAKDRAARFRQVLLGIRKMDRLIVSESDPQRLMEEACQILTRDVGFHSAWIVLLGDGAEGRGGTASAGLGEGFPDMDVGLDRGELTSCMRSAADQQGAVVIQDPTKECPDCPVARRYGGRSALIRRLAFGGRVRGFLHVSVPGAFARDPQGQRLFEELADDLVLGLRGIAETRSLAEDLDGALALFRQGPLPYQSLDKGGIILEVNPAWRRVLGYEEKEEEEEEAAREELVEGSWFGDHLTTEGQERFREILAELRQTGWARGSDLPLLARTGEVVPMAFQADVGWAPGDVPAGEGEPAASRWLLEPASKTHDRTFPPVADTGSVPGLSEHVEDSIWAVDRDYRLVMDNQAFRRTVADIRGRAFASGETVLGDDLDPGIRTEWRQYYDWALEGRRFNVESRGYYTDPSRRVEYAFNPVRDAHGAVVGAAVKGHDVTERREIEEELRRRERRLVESQRIAGIGDVMWDLETGEVNWSDALYDLLGYDPSEEMDFRRVRGEVHHPEDAARVEAWLQECVASGRDQLTPIEYRVVRRDGEILFVHVAGVIERRAGRAPRVFATIQDITERKEAEEERLKLEEKYLMSQKMEALGQLTGGVAHDFNNLLQVVNGGAEIALLDLSEDHPAHDAIQQIADAGRRAARLVSQLLFFGRRQVMQPDVLDLNETIRDILTMLTGVMGEQIHVHWHPGPDVSPVRADRSMVEQALVNLCVNARDAMPEGGELTIETRDVEIGEDYQADHPWARPGRYVLLRVADTGHGMDQQTLDHIFEPFFSTKETGKGSGLGLSTVYGIVKQHDGMIDALSEPGRGTAFHLYWPVAQVPSKVEENEDPEPVEGGQETILLAEDEEMVRNMAQTILERAGYQVLAVGDGVEALATFQQRAHEIDLVILDVIMPKLGGQETYERMRAHRPGLRALFASGYSREAVRSDFALASGLSLIQKPFSRKDLLQAVRDALGEPARRGT
jgi:PAS domain S-box-containing protein